MDEGKLHFEFSTESMHWVVHKYLARFLEWSVIYIPWSVESLCLSVFLWDQENLRRIGILHSFYSALYIFCRHCSQPSIMKCQWGWLNVSRWWTTGVGWAGHLGNRDSWCGTAGSRFSRRRLGWWWNISVFPPFHNTSISDPAVPRWTRCCDFLSVNLHLHTTYL